MPNMFNVFLDFTQNYVGTAGAVIMFAGYFAGDWVFRKLPPLLYEKLKAEPSNKLLNFLLFDVLRKKSPVIYD